MFLVPSTSIITVRGGKRVILDPGVSHEFTAEEAEQLLGSGTAREAHSGDKIGGALLAPESAPLVAAARARAAGGGGASAKEIGAEIAAAIRGETAAVATTKAKKAKTSAEDDGGL